MSDLIETSIIAVTADIVSAFVSNNTVRPSELPEVISAVHEALLKVTRPQPASPEVPALMPAVPVKKSVTDDYLISLEDGRKFKSMKRYLTGLGMTPDQYRAKWNLPASYPMVAPAYAAKRSELAKSVGLGRKQAGAANGSATADVPEVVSEPAEPIVKPKRGRPRTKQAA